MRSTLFPPEYDNLSWLHRGILVCVKEAFSYAIKTAFPGLESSLTQAIITKCTNTTFGDYQCNNAMSLSKYFKSSKHISTLSNPKDIGNKIIQHLPSSCFGFIQNPPVTAPNGFINITIYSNALVTGIEAYHSFNPMTVTKEYHFSGTAPATTRHKTVTTSVIPPMTDRPLNVLVDFSSPNIAKVRVLCVCDYIRVCVIFIVYTLL